MQLFVQAQRGIRLFRRIVARDTYLPLYRDPLPVLLRLFPAEAEASLAASSVLQLGSSEWLVSSSSIGGSSEKHGSTRQGSAELRPALTPAKAAVEARARAQEDTGSAPPNPSTSEDVRTTKENSVPAAAERPQVTTQLARDASETNKVPGGGLGSLRDGSLSGYRTVAKQVEAVALSAVAAASGPPVFQSATNTGKSASLAEARTLPAVGLSTEKPLRSDSRAAYEDLSEMLRTVGARNGEPQRQPTEDPSE